MNPNAAVVERAIAEMLDASLPPHLRDTFGVERAKAWIGQHLDDYANSARRSEGPLLPWHNWMAQDSWSLPTFFLVFALTEDAIELFCGTGYWPEIRRFGEGDEARALAVRDLHREWAARFTVPCPPLVLGKAAVKKWLGRDWE